MTHRHTGSVLYFDGESVICVLKDLPSSVAGLGLQKDRLYVSVMGTDEIMVYSIGKDPKELTLQETIPVYSAPHFFHLNGNELVVATHPNKLKYLLQRQWPYDYFAPSQVLRLKKLRTRREW